MILMLLRGFLMGSSKIRALERGHMTLSMQSLPVLVLLVLFIALLPPSLGTLPALLLMLN